MGLNDHILGVAEAIKTSSEFSRLKQAKTIISKIPSLKKELEEFNAGQKLLLAGRLSTKDAESNLKQLNAKFDSLSKVPEVDNYIKALNDFNQMMSRIYNKISEYLERDLT